MGGRLLRKYVEQPLINKEKIEYRLNIIEEINDDYILKEDLIEILKKIYDIERICGKIAFEKVTPKELINLKHSIEKLPLLKETVENSSCVILKEYINSMDTLEDIYQFEILKKIYDIERICGKIAFEKVTPKELINLKHSIEKLPLLKETVENSSCVILKEYINSMDTLEDIYQLIEDSIKEDPAITIKDGNIIKTGYNKELDELRDISKNGANIIKDIEAKEKETERI